MFEILVESSEELNEIHDLSYGDKLSGEVAQRFFLDSVNALKAEDVEAEIARLNGEYAKETDEEKRKEITRLLVAQMQKRNQLKKERKK